MIKTLLLIILILATHCQIPPTPPPSFPSTSTQVPTINSPTTSSPAPESNQQSSFSSSSTPAPAPAPPSSSAAQFDISDSQRANVANSAKFSSSGAPIVRGSYSNAFSDASQAWKYLQSLNGGCCDKCKTICGFAIRLANTNKYLTSFGSASYFAFYNSGSINQNSQVFTLSQNADCTWAISIGGNYLSTNSQFGNPYVGSSPNIGLNERWYIERLSNNQVVIQSAANQIFYWRGTSGFWSYLTTNFAWSSRLIMEYVPCDKAFGWNW